VADTKLHLPPPSTEAGAVVRLLLAEVRTPSFPDYDAATALLIMQRMKLILQNRLNHNPQQYGAPGAQNLTDIIKGHFGKGEQFAGFSHYPIYSKPIEDNIQAALDIANSEHDARAAAFATHIRNALMVADTPVIDDPSPTTLDGWRTAGSGAPSPQSVVFDTLGNITFYRTPN
jgi:hypothetical protein